MRRAGQEFAHNATGHCVRRTLFASMWPSVPPRNPRKNDLDVGVLAGGTRRALSLCAPPK